MKLSEKIKNEIERFTSEIVNEYPLETGLPDLKAIAKSEGVALILDHYSNSFEGITVCDQGQFFIHIDKDSISGKNRNRFRFTMAHELGHALIADHRIGLITGELEPHVSDYLLGNEDKLIELEADYFASSLLMPIKIFETFETAYKDPFSSELFMFLSDNLKTSELSTILRYAEIGARPIFISFTRDGHVSWYKQGRSFPEWAFKFKVGEAIPENTLIADVYKKGLTYIGEIRKVDPDDWFYVYDDEFQSYNLFEQCFILKGYDYIVSMLWFEK